jgi:hypothetical protein
MITVATNNSLSVPGNMHNLSSKRHNMHTPKRYKGWQPQKTRNKQIQQQLSLSEQPISCKCTKHIKHRQQLEAKELEALTVQLLEATRQQFHTHNCTTRSFN